MKVVITGGYGFLGWHTACRLRALHGIEPVRLGREDVNDPAWLAAVVGSADAVIHIAGVNRAGTDAEVEEGNVELAHAVALAVDAAERPVDVVYANSVQANLDNPYGRGKAAAAAILSEVARRRGGRFADLLLPNLFGEHGRPRYNSFVATFVQAVIAGRAPSVTDDRTIDLLHAQDAAAALIAAVGADTRHVVAGEPIAISEVLRLLDETHDMYATHGEVPNLSTSMHRNLFNTYRAAAFPGMWPIAPERHTDDRGDLFETMRSHGGTGMSYMSTTRPGQKRGEHYHLHKVERFCVVKGEAEIQLRRLLHDDVVTFKISGQSPAFVDMPTLWVHNLRNIGDSELVTMFWSDQLLDPHHPDQFPELVAEDVVA